MTSEKAIPEEWIKRYVDQLLEIAGRLGEGAMRTSCLMRADYVMDLVKAWREHSDKTTNNASEVK